MDQPSFLGTGWGFPPVFDKNTKSVSLLSDEADIKSSISLIISTRVGERVMRESFGSNMDSMVFEGLTTGNRALMESKVENALNAFEPRISLDRVEAEQPNPGLGLVNIHIDYRVRGTNRRDNLVYPFYLSDNS
jgi:phage baseplate assembly protein W